MPRSRLYSVLIPVYNEARTILPLMEKVRQARVRGLRREVIVVDDGSDDGTERLLRDLSFPGLSVFRHPRNLGRGAALQTALSNARGEFVVFQDADLEYDPRDHRALLAPLVAGQANAVYGSRFLGDSEGFLFWNYWANRFLTGVTNVLYGSSLTDAETGCKAFRAGTLRGLRLVAKGFESEAELNAMILKRGERPREVPALYRGRGFDEGKKIGWSDGWRSLWILFRRRFAD